MRVRLLLLPLLFCCSVPVWAAGDPAEDPPDTLAPPEPLAPAIMDDLAAWRSPVAGPLLTDGEYRMIRSTIKRRVPLPGTHGQELVLVPFETGSGDPALSIAVLTREGERYRSCLLANVLSRELASVRVVRLGAGGAPRIVLTEQGGSGGFLTVRVFSTSGGVWRPTWTAAGIYQGGFRLVPGTHSSQARVRRFIAGKVNAFPKGLWRETYVWRRDGFHLVGRKHARLKPPATPDEPSRPLHAHALN